MIAYGWIFASHQVGAAVAATGAGVIRTVTGDYFLAFVSAGLLCLVAAVLSLGIGRSEVAATTPLVPGRRWRGRRVRAGWRAIEGGAHGVGVVLDDAEVGSGRAVRPAAALLPVADIAQGQFKLPGEFALGETQVLADRLRIRARAAYGRVAHR